MTPITATSNVLGLRIVLARIGLISNNPDLLYIPAYLDGELQERNPRIWPLLSSLHRVERIPFSGEMDGYIQVMDSPETPPFLEATPDWVYLTGDISGFERDLDRNPPHRRWTLFGNGGILSKFTYQTLERRHGMLSFHATSMYDEARDEMYIIVGPPGAGKTVMMLEGCLRRGYRLFATEMTHVRFGDGGATFYKGSLYDNIRVKTVVEDYPDAVETLAIPNVNPEKAGEAKIGVSFTAVQTGSDVIVNPGLNLLFPRIEAESSASSFKPVDDEVTLIRMLYENASEMIVRPRLYYRRIPFANMDYPGAAANRWRLCERLVRETRVSQALSIFAGARNCMAGVR